MMRTASLTAAGLLVALLFLAGTDAYLRFITALLASWGVRP